MSSAARRFRGELRRLAHPAIPAAVLGIAVTTCALQTQVARTEDRPPSPQDLTGAVRIAAQHHASALGFLLVGLAVGLTSGTDARIGALGRACLAEPSRIRLWARRIAAVVAVVVASSLLSTAALRVTSGWTACRVSCPAPARSSLPAGLGDAAATLLVVSFAAALATVLGLALRSELLTVVVAVAIYLVPSNHLGTPAAWTMPTKWITELLHFEPYGLGRDYAGGMSADAHRSWHALLGGLLLAGGSVGLGLVAIALIRRRSAEGERG